MARSTISGWGSVIVCDHDNCNQSVAISNGTHGWRKTENRDLCPNHATTNQPGKTECGFCEEGVYHKNYGGATMTCPCPYCEGTGYAPTKEDQ